jgi:hypothetical protein
VSETRCGACGAPPSYQHRNGYKNEHPFCPMCSGDDEQNQPVELCSYCEGTGSIDVRALLLRCREAEALVAHIRDEGMKAARLKPPCTCKKILHEDKTRHFRGCARRELYPDTGVK